MKHRFYLGDVADCMGVVPDRVRWLCEYHGIKVHGIVAVIDRYGTDRWLSWTGVETLARKNWPGDHLYRFRTTTPRQAFLNKAWEKRREQCS